MLIPLNRMVLLRFETSIWFCVLFHTIIELSSDIRGNTDIITPIVSFILAIKIIIPITINVIMNLYNSSVDVD